MLMPPASAPTTPLLLLLGAQGSGAPALASALQSQCAKPGVTVRVWEEPCGRGDDEGLAAALQATGAAEWTLLMGLDLPCPDDQRAAQEAADARLRAALEQTRADAREALDAMRRSHRRDLVPLSQAVEVWGNKSPRR